MNDRILIEDEASSKLSTSDIPSKVNSQDTNSAGTLTRLLPRTLLNLV